MTATFYNEISARLQTLSWFAYFRLFNNQFESMEGQTEQTFPNLSIFMEFLQPVPLIDGASGIQYYDLTVRFHLYLITYELQDLDMFTYKTQMHEVLQGYSPTNSSSLNRVFENPDQNHNGYMVWQIDYAVQIADETGSYFKNVVDAAPVGLNLAAELIIDNDIIRTGTLD